MKVLKKYNQTRRDCYCDLVCEGCGHAETHISAYDDRNFWDNVIPNKNCKKCGKTTVEMGIKPDHISTKYADYECV